MFKKEKKNTVPKTSHLLTVAMHVSAYSTLLLAELMRVKRGRRDSSANWCLGRSLWAEDCSSLVCCCCCSASYTQKVWLFNLCLDGQVTPALSPHPPPPFAVCLSPQGESDPGGTFSALRPVDMQQTLWVQGYCSTVLLLWLLSLSGKMLWYYMSLIFLMFSNTRSCGP